MAGMTTTERVWHELIGVGDGLRSYFSGTLKHTPVKPWDVGGLYGLEIITGSMLNGTHRIVFQDKTGDGKLQGNLSDGFLVYQTGKYVLNFRGPPAKGEAIYADYYFLMPFK